MGVEAWGPGKGSSLASRMGVNARLRLNDIVRGHQCNHQYRNSHVEDCNNKGNGHQCNPGYLTFAASCTMDLLRRKSCSEEGRISFGGAGSGVQVKGAKVV